MDKKKVETHVEDAIAFLDKLSNYVNGYNNNVYLRNAIKALDMAKAELSKPDWISVEDGLPEYMEKVFVTNKEHRDFVWKSHRENGDIPKRLDDNGFPAWQHHYPYYPVTHWHPIEKLEE